MNIGAVFTSRTTMVTVCVALRLGEPSSVTMTWIMFVAGPWASVGVQVKKPLAGLIVAPTGAVGARLKVRLFGGTSGSVAGMDMASCVPSSTACTGMDPITGG